MPVWSSGQSMWSPTDDWGIFSPLGHLWCSVALINHRSSCLAHSPKTGVQVWSGRRASTTVSHCIWNSTSFCVWFPLAAALSWEFNSTQGAITFSLLISSEPRHLAKNIKSCLSMLPGLSTDLGPPCEGFCEGKAAATHLHANDCVDEEEHSNEQGNIWECLWETRRVGGLVPHEASPA